MITTVMFDMGGTLEDIFVDDRSEAAAIDRLHEMLTDSCGMSPLVEKETQKQLVRDGWARYAAYRDMRNVELKPVEIWSSYILREVALDKEALAEQAEAIAHMWEITYYHRSLRPRVAEMLDGLRAMGLHLGVISNTAALYQVFDSLKEYGIRDYFEDVTLSSVTGIRKPDPEIFHVSLCQLQAKPQESIYVGDTVSRDIIGSKRAGFARAIQIGSKLTGMKDLGIRREYEPDYRIEDIYEVYPIVQRLVQGA